MDGVIVNTCEKTKDGDVSLFCPPSKIEVRFIVGLVVAILGVQLIYSTFSIYGRIIDLQGLRGEICDELKTRVEDCRSIKYLSDEEITSRIESFAVNSLAVTLGMSVLASILVLFIFRLMVGRYIARLTMLNASSSSQLKHYEFSNIPNNEIGGLIYSREKLLHRIESLMEGNRTLLRTLSHDLNNLISIGTAAVPSLKSGRHGTLSEGQLKYVQRIEQSFNRQSELIKSVRELDAMESGKEKILLSEVFLSEILEDIFFIFDARLKEKKLELAVTGFHGKDPIKVRTNKIIFVNSVLANIISNAIKFSKENSQIVVSINSPKGSDHIRISIKDSGIGMPKELMEKIFDSGAATTRPGLNGEKGTGFGMPILKSSLEKMGGSITVESKNIDEYPIDHGTVFHIAVPA